MSYTARDTGEFVRNAGKGSTERNHGARKNYDEINWNQDSQEEGWSRLSPKRVKKVYKLK